jgi:hypothetical protein
MGFSLSPVVNVTEFDQTLTVPAVATSIGAMVGNFAWGPVEEVTLVDSETNLVKIFNKPDDSTYASFFSAANFLAYTNNLKVVRAVGAAALNAVAETIAIPSDGSTLTEGASITATPLLIKNQDDYDQQASFSALVPFYAKYAGSYGNNITVHAVNGAEIAGASTWATVTYTTADGGTGLWTNQFDYEPTGDDIFIMVEIDGNIVERFAASQNSTEIDPQGGTAYFVEVINRTSKYIWCPAPAIDSGISHQNDGISVSAPYSGTLTASYSITPVLFSQTLALGVDDAPLLANYQTGWNLFSDADAIDVNLCLQGAGGSEVGKYISENISSVRKDCVAYMSPNYDDVVGSATPAADIVLLRGSGGDFATSTSYAFIDGNYKYQYDKYNDTYRWVPLNGDVAGTAAYTDEVRDAWWSHAGLNRGHIKNVVKLAYNPTKAQRDELYKNNINPVVAFRGEGTVLFGDKTAQTKPSAFDRINVRRLFIVLEKAIATASKYQMFEFNDAPERAAFVNMVEPFLRDVQGRRGIQDFRVVCDETNNTGEVRDRNEFVADIYIKPNQSINYIYLNFVAVKSGVAFEEAVLRPNV